MQTPVGFIGLGQMGMPIALRLLAAGHAVMACDVRDGMRATFESASGLWAARPADVADHCEVVLLSLPTPQVVREVTLGSGGLTQGAAIRICVDLSTTGPALARELASSLARQSIDWVDAPVSGGVAGAREGTLSLMLSGPRIPCDRLMPLLAAFSNKVFQVGEHPGQGHLMKLINNLLSTTALAATLEALTAGVKAGLEPATMLEVLSVSSGTNHAIEHKIPKYLLQGLPMGFSLDLSLKDVKLAVSAGEALGLPMPMGHATAAIWQQALDAHGPGQDYLQVVRVFENLVNIRWTPPTH